MFRKILRTLPVTLAAAFSVQALAQPVGAPPPQSYDQSRYQDERYDYDAAYEFDRGLLAAVDGCARRASRVGLRRVVIDEVARIRGSRYQVIGHANQAGYRDPRDRDREEDREYRDQAWDRDRDRGYRDAVAFRCAADGWGRVTSWEVYRS